jgi:uncharacterized lipoprotein YmbA
MTKSARTRLVTLAALAAGLALASCADSQPTRYYTLAALPDAPDAALPATPPALTVGVGPVTLPPYLDRPQLVTRAGSNRVVLADIDSWAEPLDGLFARVLAENLALLLGTDDVLLLPQRRLMSLDYRVEADVTRFDVDASGNAVLDARWWLLGPDGEKLLRSGRSTITEPAEVGDYAAGAAALSRALGVMSEEIAQAIADEVLHRDDAP